jgi:SAM-dependent methyltransferase
MNTPNRTFYEKLQSHNALLAWVHSRRFTGIRNVFERLAGEITDRPIRVLEVGCAHGKLFEDIDSAFNVDYIGIELREDFVAQARERFAGRANCRIVQGSASEPGILAQGWGVDNGQESGPDIVVALETLEHIPESDCVRVVENIAALKPRLFVLSVPVEVGPAVWIKNVSSWLMGYIRHREYTWAETFWAGLYKLDRLPAHGVEHKGFDWRWLAQTVRHNMRIIETRTHPLAILPPALSTSVFIVAVPRKPGEVSVTDWGKWGSESKT